MAPYTSPFDPSHCTSSTVEDRCSIAPPKASRVQPRALDGAIRRTSKLHRTLRYCARSPLEKNGVDCLLPPLIVSALAAEKRLGAGFDERHNFERMGSQ